MATEQPPATGRRHSAWFNWLTLIGAVLAIGGVAVAPFVFLIEVFVKRPPPYIGLLYAPFVIAIIAGTLLVPLGFLLASRKRARGEELQLPVQLTVDFSQARHRYVLAALAVGGLLSALVLTTGTFSAYEAMESNAFCGQACHSVMTPEATAHAAAPHAQVNCVQCHIGSGVEHYIEAKINGMRQLKALVTGTVKRPIPTPVANMRPASEICLTCHTAKRFAGLKEKVFSYYTSGDASPEHKMRMLIKVGGGEGDSLFVKGAGIHYHMQTARKVEYIARDAKRQEIAWVKVTRTDGTSTEYNHGDFPLTAEAKAKLKPRTMDCLDCHNRPAHNFKAPIDAVDQAIAAGQLSRKLPAIKVQAVKALDGKYETTSDAMKGIAERMTKYYKDDHPEVMAKQGPQVEAAIAKLQAIYQTSFFPEMKAKWSAYPENISHRDWPGCFRCHAPAMTSDKGQSPATGCSTCHLILAQDAQVDRGAVVNFAKGKPFDHPGYGDTINEPNKCIDCHTGGADLY